MKLLIGYDGSECSSVAINDLKHAGLAPVVDAVVLTTADVWAGLLEERKLDIDPGSRLAVERFIGPARARAEKAVADGRALAQRGADQLARLFPQWHVSADAVADTPHWALLKRAEELRADLIVVGSHGHSALQRAILGSVSQAVLHNASCSVRIARGPARSDVRPLRILLGVDGSVDSATAVSAVASRKWPGGSEVRVVTAADLKLAILMFSAGSPNTISPKFRGGVPDDERAYATRMLDQVARELRESGLAVSTSVGDGDPKRVLLQEADDWAADCIFVGSQGLSRIGRLLIGSVSSAIAARAHCSVEVVRSSVL